jgi:hypothetical protein
VAPSIRKKLAITSPTSGGRSVGTVRSRTQTMELKLKNQSQIPLVNFFRMRIISDVFHASFPQNFHLFGLPISIPVRLLGTFHGRGIFRNEILARADHGLTSEEFLADEIYFSLYIFQTNSRTAQPPMQ